MKKYTLQPLDGRKSFYNKCVVEQTITISRLFSYGAEVATYNHITSEMRVHDYHSAITMRHINAFLDHFGFEECDKKSLTERYLTLNKDFLGIYDFETVN